MQSENLPLYVDTDGAAKLLGLSRSSLEKYRHFSDPNCPPFAVFGRGAIRYSTEALFAWAECRTVKFGER